MRMLEGPEERIAAIERHRGMLLRYASKCVDDMADAEDLLQELALRALRYDLPADSPLCQRWLRTILRSLVYRYRRDRGEQTRSLGVVLPLDGVNGHAHDSPAEDLADPSPGPEQAALDRLVVEHLASVVREMTPDERHLLLAITDGHGPTEIARELDCSRQTIHNRLNRLREHLANSLLEAPLAGTGE